jgi:histidine triad (HIT) family protein
MSACIFCGIIEGSVAAHHVLRDDTVCAFLDTRPLFAGHVLVIPSAHCETLTDLDPNLLGPFFTRVQQIAHAVELGMNAEGTHVAMNNRVSQSVPHLHVHVVPRRRKDGLRGFFWPRTKYASDELARETAEKIKAALNP